MVPQNYQLSFIFIYVNHTTHILQQSKMFPSINVSVECRLRVPFSLSFYSHMSVFQLTEFLLCSHVLHQTSQTQRQSRPIGLASTNGNLLIDYMLTNLEWTVSEVYMAYKYLKAKERLSLHYIKQHELNTGETCEKQESLPIMILYEHQPEKNLIKNREFSCYIQEDSFGAMNQKPTSSPKLSTNESFLDFTEIIQRTSASSPILIKKTINKSQLGTFEQVQRVILLKKRLIEHTYNHQNIYGDLKEILEEQHSVLFCFTYVPTVSFSDIMHLQLTYNTVEYLINKIWVFLTYLKNNNYEAYICRLHRQRNLKELLDKLHLGLDNRIIITDLNALLEEGGNQRFHQDQYENLIEDVKIYVKLHKSHLLKFDDYQQVEQEKSINLISSFTFSKVFLTKTYKLHSRLQEQYSPKTDIFTWKCEVLNPQSKEKNINEATTAKKPRSNMRLSIEKKHKKHRERSPNCSLVHCSVNKTKWKRHK